MQEPSINICFKFTKYLSEGLNKNTNKFGGIFHRGGGGLPILPKLLILYPKIKNPQTDPNTLKHEIYRYKYFTNFDHNYPHMHPTRYLVERKYISI